MIRPGDRLSSYHILSELGSGGMGRVFKARDEKLGRDIAIKVLKATDPDRLRRFEQEARAASALNHPNIVTIHEIGEHDGTPYIAMEYVEGQTLRELLADGPLPNDQLHRYATQMAEGLAKAHQAGIVHRDLKPENVIVATDGYAKILDFGLAKQVGASAEDSEGATLTKGGTAPGVILGSVGYMAPEQAKGQPTGAKADQFAFGAVLYELVSGRRAFDGDSAIETLAAIIEREPEPTGTPLDPVISRCLSKDPAARFDSMREALAAIHGRHDRLSRPALARTVGRERSLAELDSAFSEARERTGCIRAIAGEAGIGKTTLADAFLGGLDGAIVARGRCSERLAGAEPYLPFLEALEGLCRDSSVLDLARDRAPRWTERLLTHAASRTNPADDSSPERMKREFAAFLEGLSSREPVAILLEDLHWADVSTVDLIAHLAVRLDSLRTLVVVTYRPAELELSDNAFLSVKQDLQGKRVLRESALPFLTRDEVDNYVALEFPEHQFPSSFLKLIFDKTEGSPLFMVDLLHYLRDTGIVERRGGRWLLTGTMDSIDAVLPQSVRGMIDRKLARLDREDRDLLVAASVEGYTFRSAVLAHGLERGVADVEERLDELDRVHGLVKLVGEEDLPDGTFSGRYRFVHVLYQNALESSLTPSRRVATSRKVAASLAHFFERGEQRVATDLAVLWEAGRQWARAARCYGLASENANRVYASHEAARLSERGLDLLERVADTRERKEHSLRLHLALARANVLLRGHSDARVGELYDRAWELSQEIGDGEQSSSVLAGIWGFRVVRGDMDGALEAAKRLLDFADRQEDANARALADLEIGMTQFYSSRFDEALHHLDRVFDVSEQVDTHAVGFGLDARINVRRAAALVDWARGYPDRARAMMAEARDLTSGSEHLISRAYMLAFSGMLESFLRDKSAAAPFGRELVTLSGEQGYRLFRSWGTLLGAWAESDFGKLKRELRFFRKELGANLLVPFFAGHAADLALEAGDCDEAIDLVDAELRPKEKLEVQVWNTEFHRLRGEALAGRGDIVEAEATLRRAVEIGRDGGAKLLGLRALTSLTRFLARQGRADEIAGELETLLESFEEGFETPDLRDARAALASLGEG